MFINSKELLNKYSLTQNKKGEILYEKNINGICFSSIFNKFNCMWF